MNLYQILILFFVIESCNSAGNETINYDCEGVEKFGDDGSGYERLCWAKLVPDGHNVTFECDPTNSANRSSLDDFIFSWTFIPNNKSCIERIDLEAKEIRKIDNGSGKLSTMITAEETGCHLTVQNVQEQAYGLYFCNLQNASENHEPATVRRGLNPHGPPLTFWARYEDKFVAGAISAAIAFIVIAGSCFVNEVMYSQRNNKVDSVDKVERDREILTVYEGTLSKATANNTNEYNNVPLPDYDVTAKEYEQIHSRYSTRPQPFDHYSYASASVYEEQPQ